MKVIHFCVSCFYIDGYRYQENELVRRHVQDGHEVIVVASTENYGPDGHLVWGEPREYMGTDGAKVIRLPYSGPFPFFMKKKLRIHRGIYDFLAMQQPDVIMFHGLCGWELGTVARYKRRHPKVRLYVDSHEDANNSGTSFASRHLLHGLYYRSIITASLSAIDKILCISLETIDFCRTVYGIPSEKLEFYPLGGDVYADREYERSRAAKRAEYEWSDDEVVFLQSGKFDEKKRLDDSLAAFATTTDARLRFIIVGKLSAAAEEKVRALSRTDPRIRYLGWKSADELHDLLCAADVYVQPGSQSVTMQMSLCARCPVILADVPSHVPYVDGNGWKVTTVESLSAAFKQIEFNPSVLKNMSARSLQIASKLLDYRKLAERLLH